MHHKYLEAITACPLYTGTFNLEATIFFTFILTENCGHIKPNTVVGKTEYQ
jgi:hypothetical protein